MSPVVVYTMGELKGHRIAELSFILCQSKPFWFELCVLGAFDTFTYIRKYYIYITYYIYSVAILAQAVAGLAQAFADLGDFTHGYKR